MDELASAIAEPARERGVAREAVGVAHVGEHPVERRVEARGARGQQRMRSCVQHFRTVDRPGAAEIGVEVAVLRATEGERRHPLCRDRHLEGAEHAARALDREHELHRACCHPALGFERADHRVPARDLVAALDLGEENPGDSGHADDGVEVPLGQSGIEAVDAYPDAVVRDPRPVCPYAGAGIGLLGGRHGIFQVEDEGVRRQADRLLQEFLAVGRDIEEAARKRHGVDPSSVIVRLEPDSVSRAQQSMEP
jgi:hypothetical protein